MEDISIGTKIALVLTEAPLGISFGDMHFPLYPQTLGRMYLTSHIVEKLEINKGNLEANAYMEALRVVANRREDCCKFISYHTFHNKSALLNKRIIEERGKIIAQYCDDEDLATILITILSENKVGEIIKALGIDKETERMSRITQAKDSKGQFVFGGKSVWGALIDAACERYGWTFDYVLWNISYANLTLMMKDKITSIYLSDEERKKAHIPASNETVFNGNNKDDIMRMVRESEENPM